MKETAFKKYYRLNRDKRKKDSIEYFKTTAGKKTIEKFKENHPDYYKTTQRNYLANLRKSVVEALGGKCKKCGFTDTRALQIDHINGGGSKERKERNYKGTFHKHVLASFLRGENKYQLLCANCNWIKRSEKKET